MPTVPEARTAAPAVTGYERPPLPPDPRARRRWLLPALVAGFLVLVGAGAFAGWLAFTNKDRADSWQARALELERNVEALNDVLVERTASLNERTEELNALAEKVTEAETAIRRSEADVSALERRQRQLANEKAQIEDARAALAVQAESLEDVASAYIGCKDGLVELLNHILNEDYSSATAIYDRVDGACQAADGELAEYLGDRR